MFCQFCKVEVPAAWAKVIASNKCPNCEEAIISDEQRKIMDELKEAISKMSASPEELVGWLMSTYDLLPKGTVQPTEFHRKPNGSNVDTASAASQFMKRAGGKVITDPRIKALAHAINNSKDIEESMYGFDSPEISVEENPEMMIDENTDMPGMPLSMEEIVLMQNKVNKVNIEKDVGNLPPALQGDRLKRLAAQRELSRSGSTGLIRRSS